MPVYKMPESPAIHPSTVQHEPVNKLARIVKDI